MSLGPQEEGSRKTAPTLTVAEVEAMVESKLAARQQERQRTVDELPQSILLWLALVPTWTEALLRHVARRQRRSEGEVDRVIGELESQGWLRRKSALRLPGRPHTPDLLELIPEAAERQLAPHLEGGASQGLWTEILTLGRIISEVATSTAEDSRSAVPELTRRWAALVVAAEVRQSFFRRSLGNRSPVESWQPVADLLDGKVETLPSGKALRWIEAAQPLAKVLSRGLETQLDLAIRRSVLRLELRDRRRHDLEHLKSFLERGDQIAALERLLGRDGGDYSAQPGDDDLEPWALHLLGSGGVGKTMLVRHLTAQLADAAQWHLSVARVDFDFLNPDYPRLAPGLLLWAFAQELRVFDRTGSAGQAFDDSERILRQLHDLLEAGEAPGGRATEHPLFLKGIEIYAQALELLPEPVVLVVDTCEELTKPRAGADSRFNVDETFRILEILHARLPSLRVVFAGRRPLAAEGAGWRCSDCDLPPRPFLCLFEMRGFSQEEARIYLRRGEVPEDLVEPVVRRSSPDAGSAAKITWLQGEGPSDIVRCNPYELRFFSEWARDDPPPSPQDIEQAGGDRYVELRILRRLHNAELASLLPILGVARHVDEELLQAVSGLDDGDFGVLLEDLLKQEWVERRVTNTSKTPRRILSVDEGLRLRLLSYAANHPGQLANHRQTATRVLRRRTLEGDPAELDAWDVDAALRVMTGMPEADLWWRQVEERLLAERDAPWVAQQTSLLVGPEGAAAVPDEASWPELRSVHPLRPAVLATWVLASGEDLSTRWTEWMEVAEGAGQLPNIGADLALRAEAMILVARRDVGQEIAPGDAWDLWQRCDALSQVPTAETAAALVAAVEAWVEQAEEQRDKPWSERSLLLRIGGDPESDEEYAAEWAPEGLLRRFAAWENRAAEWTVAEVSGRLQAMLLALAGRVTARLGAEPGDAVERFERAITLAESSPPGRLLAWREPEHLTVRLRLEAMRALYPAVMSPAACFGKFGALDGPSDGIERDRFLAMIVELVLAQGSGAEAFPIVRQAEVDDPVMEPTCRAHFDTPPLQVQMARLAAMAGDMDSAHGTLEGIARQASRYPTSVVRHAARVELELAVRLRLLDGMPGTALGASRHEEDRKLLELFETLGGEPRTKVVLSVGDSRGAAHDAWQVLIAPSPERRQEAVALASHRIQQLDYAAGAAVPEAIDLHLVLDGWEAFWQDYPDRFLSWVAERLPAIAVRQPVEAWELKLRLLVAEGWRYRVPQDTTLPKLDALAESLMHRLGSRRAGLVAWRQGDYLALRSPTTAAVLFAIARDLLAKAGDVLGEAICCTAQACCLASDPAIRLSSQWLADLMDCWSRVGVEVSILGVDEDLRQAVEQAPSHLRPWWARALLLSVSLSPVASLRQELPRLARRYLGERREPMLAWVDRSFREPAAGRGFEMSTGTLGGDWQADDQDTEVFLPGDLQGKEAEPDEVAPSPPSSVSDETPTKIDAGPQGPQTAPYLPPRPPVTAPSKGASSAPSGTEEAAQETSNWWAVLGCLVLLVPLAALGAILVAGFFSVLWTGAQLGIDLPTYGWISVYVLLFVLGFLTLRGIGKLRALRRGSRWLEIEIARQTEDVRSDDFGTGLHLTMTQITTAFRLGRWPPWQRLRHPSSRPCSVAIDSEPHRWAYGKYLTHWEDPRVAELIAQLSRSPMKARLRVLEMQHRPEVAWEGVLSQLPTTRPWQFRRQVTLPRPSDETWGEDDGPFIVPGWPELPVADETARGVVIASSSKRGVDMAIQGWQPLDGSKIEPRILEEPELPSLVASRKDLIERPERVVHLIGAVIETSAGRRFRLSRTETSSQPLSKSGVPSRAGGEVVDLRAVDIAFCFPDLCLLVLQEDPVVAMHSRSAADRRQADWLRQFAHDAQGAAGPAVVTVPHLLPQTAAKCIRPLAELLKNRRRGLGRMVGGRKLGDSLADFDTSLLDAVDKIRQVIREAGKEEVDAEAAWDIVLYAPAGWRHPYRREG